MRWWGLEIPTNAGSWLTLCALASCMLLGGCHSKQLSTAPSIEIDTVPPAGEGGPVTLVPIAGRVTGAHPGDKVVLFARAANGIWWVQPVAIQPLTPIAADSSWYGSDPPGNRLCGPAGGTGISPPRHHGCAP